MRKSFRIAVGTGLCVFGSLGFAHSSFGAGNAVSVDKFELQVFEETLAASELVTGDFTAAVKKILGANYRRAEFSINTNLCVAYTAQGELARAEEHCQLANLQSKYRSPGQTWARKSTREKQALALNNLGVLNALQGKEEQALRNFAGAGSKSRKFTATADRNMVVLKQRSAAAAASS